MKFADSLLTLPFSIWYWKFPIIYTPSFKCMKKFSTFYIPKMPPTNSFNTHPIPSRPLVTNQPQAAKPKTAKLKQHNGLQNWNNTTASTNHPLSQWLGGIIFSSTALATISVAHANQQAIWLTISLSKELLSREVNPLIKIVVTLLSITLSTKPELSTGGWC